MDTIVTPVTVITLDSTRIVHSIKADLVARYFPPVVRLVQYDQSLPVIAVSMMQNGQTYTLPSGAAANIRVHKPDATYVYNPALGCDSTRNIVYFEVTQAMAAANGDGLAIVEIVVDGDIAGTSLITLHFEDNPVPEDAIESSDEWETIYELGERIIASTVTPVSTAAGMTDHNVVYLYTGTESGWNQGHMYYYNGTTWVDAGIASTDKTLSVENMAADAKATGDAIATVKDGLNKKIADGDIAFTADNVGKYVKSDGTYATSGAYKCSDFIEVPEFTKTIKIGNTFKLGTTTYHLTPAVVFFDSSQNVLQDGRSTADYAVFTIPSGTKYIRFNQPNEGHSNVNSIIGGFWFVSELPEIISGIGDDINEIGDNINEIGDNINEIVGDGDVTVTFTSARQVVSSEFAVKSGTVYRISLASAYTPTDRATGQINVFSNGSGGSANYIKLYHDTSFIDFLCGVDGNLAFYNYGGYVGTVNIKVESNLELALDDTPIVYHVGQDQKYTSFTALLLQLKDDKRPKTIIVDGGDYDIFQEYKALETAGLIDTVPTSNFDPMQGFAPYNVFVPDNTHIIGKGIVHLNYMPDGADTYENEAKARAPINTAGSMILENVEIYCKNGRYCIHDEPLQDSKYTGAIKKYIGVKCFKYAPDNANYGTLHCTGTGIGSQMQIIYQNCLLDNQISSGTPRTLYFHDRKTVGGVTLASKYSSRIVVENCVIKNGSGVYAVFLGNIGGGDALHIEVDINNCSIGGAIVAADEGSPTSGNNPNSFDIRVLFSKYANLVVRYAQNAYIPQVYSY